MENSSEVMNFILEGLTNAPELQIPLFILFTFIYLFSALGNLGMILLILLDSHLHTPMYFFIFNLSLVDLGYSTGVTPKVMSGLLIGDKIISYNACAAQMSFFSAFATVENFLLAAMSFDRYAAVCKPLHYTTTMTTSMCVYLVMLCYTSGFLGAFIHVGIVFHLSYCKSNLVHHFFCDIPAVMALTCSDKHISEMVLSFVAGCNILTAVLIILISYLFIFISILKVHSDQGHQKAFFTCASHLTAVTIFYAPVIFMYVLPNSSHTMNTDKVSSVFYSMVVPMLNPVVYSLRNKDVNRAFKKVLGKKKLSLRAGF